MILKIQRQSDELADPGNRDRYHPGALVISRGFLRRCKSKKDAAEEPVDRKCSLIKAEGTNSQRLQYIEVAVQ